MTITRSKLKQAYLLMTEIDRLEKKLDRITGNSRKETPKKASHRALTTGDILRRQQQGKYMSALRGLSATQRKEIKDWRVAHGMRAAILKAKSLQA